MLKNTYLQPLVKNSEVKYARKQVNNTNRSWNHTYMQKMEQNFKARMVNHNFFREQKTHKFSWSISRKKMQRGFFCIYHSRAFKAWNSSSKVCFDTFGWVQSRCVTSRQPLVAHVSWLGKKYIVAFYLVNSHLMFQKTSWGGGGGKEASCC